MILVELFTTEGCTPCEGARELLERIRHSFPLTVREIRLHAGDALYEEYREIVPVVHINRVPEFRRRLPEGMLRIRLQQIAGGRDRPATEEDAGAGEVLP